MEVNISNQSGLDAILSVSLQESDYNAEFDKSLKDYGRKMNVPGFRPGKVPRGVIRKLIGKDAKRETVEKFLQKSIQDYLEANKIRLVLSPLSTYHAEDIDWMQPNFEFTYDIGLRPKLNLNLKPLNELTKYVVNVSDEELKKDVNNLRRQAAKMEYVDLYENTEDYYVWVKFTELDESGQPVEDGLDKTKSFEHNTIPEKLAKIINGKEKEFETTVKIADIFSEEEMMKIFEIDELSAKDLFPDFKISIATVLKLEPADLDEHFFNHQFPGENIVTEEQFYDKWRGIMESYFNSQADNILSKEVKNNLLEHSKIELPEQFVKKYFDMWLTENPKESETGDYDKDMAGFKDDVKWQILAEQVAEEQAMEISEDEVIHFAEGMIYNILSKTNKEELTNEKIRQYALNYLTKDNNYSQVTASVRDGKVFDWLLAQIDPIPETVSMSKFEDIKNNSQLPQN